MTEPTTHPTKTAGVPFAQDAAPRAVVLLGVEPGSTSVAAKVLSALGLRVISTAQPSGEADPNRPERDAIAEANRAVLEELSPAPAFTPPTTDQLSPRAQDAVAGLRAQLAQQIEGATVLGFSDPSIGTMLPVYRQVFQSLGVVPVYVFCAVDGAAVVEKLIGSRRLSRTEAEQFYLTRSLMALRDTGGNAFVLHHERLCADPAGQIERLSGLVWPDGPPQRLTDAARAALIAPARSQIDAAPLENPLARRIDALVQSMDGYDHDKTQTARELTEIGQIHDGYLTWLSAAQKTPASAGTGDAIASSQAMTDSGRADTAGPALAAANAALAAQLAEVQATALQLREERDRAVHIARQRLEIPDPHSRRYAAGTALLDAIKKPGRNTLALPWRLLKVARVPDERAK